MSITHLTSTKQLSQILSASKGKLTVIDFHATWCGPCHAIAPFFERLSKQYTNVNFLKCDVDAAKDVAQEYRISAMPTFIFLQGSQQIDSVRGADARALESKLKTYSMGSTNGAFSGQGQRLGGPSPSSQPAPTTSAPSGITNLDPQVKLFIGFIVAYLVLWYFSR